jgi:two-component system LytT family response regulator
MDIQLRDGTAFDILKHIHPLTQHIIFITAYNQFAIKAIKFGALDYLLKPVAQPELQEALQRYRQKREQQLPMQAQQLGAAMNALQAEALPEHIVLSNVNSVEIVKVHDIVYCKGDGPYTYFHLADGSRRTTSKPLKFYEEILSAPYFLRTHQSYLVNRDFVERILRSEYILLKNSEEIPISSRDRAVYGSD